MKMRISLSARGEFIQGTVELPREPEFVLEGLALVLERVAKQYKVPVTEVAKDLYRIVLQQQQEQQGDQHSSEGPGR